MGCNTATRARPRTWIDWNRVAQCRKLKRFHFGVSARILVLPMPVGGCTLLVVRNLVDPVRRSPLLQQFNQVLGINGGVVVPLPQGNSWPYGRTRALCLAEQLTPLRRTSRHRCRADSRVVEIDPTL